MLTPIAIKNGEYMHVYSNAFEGFFGDLACYNTSLELTLLKSQCYVYQFMYIAVSTPSNNTTLIIGGHSGHSHFGFGNGCSGHRVAGPQTQKVYGVTAKGKHVSC